MRPAVLVALLVFASLCRGGELRDAIRSGNAAHVEELLRTTQRYRTEVLHFDALGATPLHDAAWQGNPDTVRILLQYGAMLNARHLGSGAGGGSTPLDYAVLRGHAEVVELLLQRHAAINDALLLAAARTNPGIVRNLLEAGAPVNHRDRAGLSALDEAARHGTAEVAEQLLARGASPAVALQKAAESGNTPVVEVLLRHGLNPETALDSAIRNQRSDTLRALLRHLPQPSATEAALLDRCVLRGETELVRILADHGVDVTAQTATGSTPLHDAALKGYPEIAEILLEHGAAIEARDRFGATPLHNAALSGRTETAALLLRHGADVNARETESGSTALYGAASLGHAALVELLLEHGADPRLRNSAGRDPAGAATQNGFPGVADSISRHAPQKTAQKIGN